MTKIAVLSDIMEIQSTGSCFEMQKALRNIGFWEIFSCLGQDEKNILQRLEGLPITVSSSGKLGREFYGRLLIEN